MAKTLYDVQQEYEAYKSLNPDTPFDLTSFAKQMDATSGVPERESAYNPKWYNKLNAFIDTGFEKTGLPAAGKWVGGAVGETVDDVLGTQVQPVLEQVGRDTPRMIAEGLATIPMVTSGAGVPAAVGLWGNRLRRLGQAAGYGSAAVRGYSETDSPLGALVSVGSMYGANKLLSPVERGGVDVGGKAKSAIERWLAPELKEGAELAAATTAEKFLPQVGALATDVATATGINEATRQGMLSVGPNAVGLTDPARNPLTAENIAGNVAGTAFFTPQIVAALRSQPRVSPGQVKQLHDFVTAKENTLRQMQGEPDVSVTLEAVPELRSRHEALYGIVRSSLDAAREFDKIGKVEDAVRARTNALDAINEAAAGRYSPLPPDLLANIKTAVDEEVRFQPPTDPEKFTQFVGEVRSIVDTLNEGRLKYSSELAQREAHVDEQPPGSALRKRAQAELDSWKASMEANKGKSWHPEARASEVVDRLWQNGNLQPLTPEWLEKEYNASFDSSGNPLFATRVVAQKVANYALDHVDAALATESATRKADPTTGEQLDPRKAAVVKKYNDLDMQFAEALAQVPPELRDGVIDRYVDFRRQETVKPWGETHSRLAPYMQSVIRAMRSYDPETGTALLRQRNKGYQRTTLDTLVRKDANGKYVWEPNERPVPSALGGKGSVGTERDPLTGKRTKLYEQNIEGLPTKEGQDSVGALDEEEFKAALANTSQEPVRAGDFGTIHLEGEGAPAVDMPAEPSAGETALGERMSKASKIVNSTLDSMTDEQVWSLARSEFKLRSQIIPDVRAGNIKTALRAAFETMRAKDTDAIGPNAKAFLDAELARGQKPVQGASPVRQAKLFLREYFQTKEFFPGSDAKMEPHVERVARVVKKLMDPEAVKRAKTELKAQGDIINFPLKNDKIIPFEYDPNEVTPQKLLGITRQSGLADPDQILKNQKPGTKDFKVGEVHFWEHPTMPEFSKDVIISGPRQGDKVPVYAVLNKNTVADELTPISQLKPSKNTIFWEGKPSSQASSLAADIAEYNRLQAELRRIGYDKVGTPEFNEVWQKSEDVKNRYNGYVPGTEPKAQTDQLVQFSGPIRLRKLLNKEYNIGVTPDALGRIPVKSVENVLTKLGITKDELAIYRAAGMDSILRGPGNIKVEELASWMDRHTPKVEVKKLEPVRAELKSQRKGEIQHLLESKGYSIDTDMDGESVVFGKSGEDAPYNSLIEARKLGVPKDILKLAQEYIDLSDGFDSDNTTSDAATGRYGVEPKALKDMPGAVDILVRIPYKDPKYVEPKTNADFELNRRKEKQSGVLFSGPHFGESDKNVLASVRGYVETLPNGEKVFHVFEVQSDWGQKVAKREVESKELGNIYAAKNPDGGDYAVFNQDGTIHEDRFNSLADAQYYVDKSKKDLGGHPLLAVYEQLALKAAIEHARELGISKVAISDAETAMMTEMHDRFARVDDDIRMDPNATAEEKRPKIAQEPGMRAAYDVRLPNAMEKLTGSKARYADFGEHKATSGYGDIEVGGALSPEERAKNGSPAFNNKTNITARIYDITNTPETFAAFGYGKPQTEVGGASPGVVANSPQPGAFIPDVHRTIRAWVDKTLGRAGYSGSTREFLTEVAVALAKQMPDLDFYRLVGPEQGVAGSAVKGSPRGKVGVNVDKPVTPGQEFKMAQQLLQTLSHEITHMDGYIRDGLVPRPDAYSDERARVHENMQHLAANLSDDERAVMLQTVNESIPEQFRTPLRQADGRPYGTSNPDEFVAEMTSKVVMMLANDTPQGRAAAMEALDYGPTEVRELAQNTFRMIGDTLQAMRDSVAAGEKLTGNTDPFILSKGFEAIVDSAHVMTDMREADAQLAIARNLMANLDTGAGAPPARMTDAVWFRGQSALEKYQKDVPKVSQTAIEGLNDVQDSVFSAKAYNAKYTPNAFAQWLYPFTNLMTSMERQGVNLARPVLEQVMSLEPGISRLYSSMMRGFLKQNTDGSYDFNAEHPLVRKVSEEKSGPWRDAVNKVSAWQQTNRTQPMFVKDAQGVVTVNPDPKLKAQAKWDSIRSQLSPSDQQYVMNISVALDESNQLAAGHLVAHLQQTNVNHIATYLMAANKRMAYDQAQALAKRAHDAFLAGKVSSLQGTIPPEQLQALQRLLVGAQSEAAPLGNGLLAKFVEVKNLLENRPGFRSEALPHDWIVKYEDNGSTKFDSRPTEEQARYLANRLTASGKRVIGEIINKKDARAPQEFDAPDALLARVAETENFVWQNFIADMEQQHGAEVAESLREGYTPVGQSIKDMGVSGLNKFLRERRALVDREAFDYIDGTMGYLQRMSASLAIRGMQQNVRLILNDPRARFLPTFRKMVTEHVSEMLTPQSDFARKAKAFTTTYFIGANLASAAVNSTQSVSTLVPWLINGVDPRYKTSGGPVKAWKEMFQAMGTATDYSINNDWQKLAASAKSKDPRALSLDESLASSYRRHVENGGIQQTVIDDLVYGRDQRMLMNAKFGHGDYGPVPVSSMVTDKLYLASQLMLSLYKGVEHFNAKTAFLAGIRQGYELGLRGDELYQYGTKMQSLATFGGGRANAPGLVPKLSTQYTRSAVGLVNSLQQYGYGMVATYAQLAKDSIGRSKGLNAAQIRQAQKAFGTMLMTQTAVAGVLGLPFVGATLTLLEKVFGIPANQAIRTGLASLTEDDEAGATIAETALNGFPNQWTGLDLSSRLGTSSLLGTSSYRGFDLKDMVGPVGSILSNSAEALNMFGQGKPMQGFRNLVPAAFKNVVELSDTKAKYGDYGLRDKSGNLLYTPTAGKAVGYALGFRPRELSQRRQLQSMLSASNERVQNKRDRELDRAAQALLQGDPTVAQRLAQDARAGDATVDPKEILRQVSDRAVAATNERDLLATGSKWNEGERLDIARSFGENVNPRQSEVSLQQQRMTLARMLGDPRLAPTMDSMRQAVMVDQLVKQRGMPRSQAIRLVEFLDGVPPGGL